MKKISKILGSVILICGILFSACSDMLDIDVDDKLPTEDNNLDSTNDSLYSVLGILKQVQYLADRYVVLGELRADLMDITMNADQNLIDIYNNNFDNNPDNPYLTSKEYYSVINNCNYFLNNVDTTIWSGGASEYIFQREYAAVKAIRAWVYWQLALNYGKVPYITEPILTVADMNKDYKVYDIAGIADLLINDLAPYEFTEYPYYANNGTIGSGRLSYSFVPVSFLLGDLYLWKGGDYNLAKAAQHYHNLISTSGVAGGYRPDPNRGSYSISNFNTKWLIDPELDTSLSALGSQYGSTWDQLFNGSAAGDLYSLIPSDDKKEIVHLIDLTMLRTTGQSYEYKLIPSKTAISNWTDAPYVFTDRLSTGVSKEPIYRKGDLRGCVSSFRSASYGYSTFAGDTARYINKYRSNYVYSYRVPTLYLRFAEALNQLGKPSVAMAILKNGLTDSRLEDPTIVDPSEVENKPSYLDFSFISSAINEESIIGIHARGGGDVQYDTVYFAFNPTIHLTKEDSIQFVEGLILDELALETAFEGNRFHDLMRFAKRSGNTSILTNKVRLKNPTAAKVLEDEKNWFLPSKYSKVSVSIEGEKE